MHAKPVQRPAFTLIELIIVIIIMAILSVMFAVSYRRVQLAVRYNAHVDAVTEFFQRAHSYSLSTIMIDGVEPTEYYQLDLVVDEISLSAKGGGLTEVLDTFEFDSDISLQEIEIYYVPPYGDVCFSWPCDLSSITEVSSMLYDNSGTYVTEFTITKASGGYVEVGPLTVTGP